LVIYSIEVTAPWKQLTTNMHQNEVSED